MTVADRAVLPKRITKGNVSTLIGESAYWFCSACRKWRTSSITTEGITCSVCGGGPDWDKRPPTLSYRSRFRRVQELCAKGSGWRKWYDEAERHYADYIDDVHAGRLPRSAKESGRRYFQGIWREVDKLADFLLTAPDAPAMDVPHAYTEAGLRRKYYDGGRKRRKHNTVSLSDLNLWAMCDDSGMRLTNEEAVEAKSFHNVGCQPFCDTYFPNGFLEAIADPLERSVAEDLSMGVTKRDVERKYKLSEQQVRTIVKHIGKSLRTI